MHGKHFPIAKLSEDILRCTELEYHGMANIVFPKPMAGNGSIKIKYLAWMIKQNTFRKHGSFLKV